MIDKVLVLNNGAQGFGENGLLRFDGDTWTHYNISNSDIPSNAVTSIEIDKNGHLWMGTHKPMYGSGNGMILFDGENFTSFNMANSGITGVNVPSSRIDTNGAKWMITNGGLDVYEGDGRPTANEEYAISGNNDGLALRCYPNPGSGKTTVTYSLPTPQKVSISVYNANGQQVMFLQPNTQAATNKVHEVSFDSEKLPEGLYFVQVRVDNLSQTIKLVVVR
ncbi:MAG: T9SS type A sorting domain-containing protein [Bacteroidales bacterium]|nr:T9SS type A sorting domain-containing protein [Bacteroidales bacterium]